MSKKKKNRKEEIDSDYFDTHSGHYKKCHIKEVVGEFDIPKYYVWCKENGFRPNIKLKTWSDMEKEKCHKVRKHTADIFKKHREMRDPKKVLDRIFAGDKTLNKRDLVAPYSVIYDGLKKLSKEKKILFKDFIEHLQKNSDLLKDAEFIPGLLNILEWYECKITSFDSWLPKSYNPQRQFSELLRHLFVKYDVPLFMDYVWLEDCNTQFISAVTKRDWYIFIGQGGNLRKAAELPVKMTKKIAHLFMQAPQSYTIENALLYGQILSLGGDQRTVEGVLGTRLNGNLQQNEFWQSVFRFFISNPMLDTVHYGPIIDYINHMKFENQYVWLERGIREQQPPLQPGFSMHGRNAEVLLAQVEEWHRRLGRAKKGGKLQWEKCSIPDFEYVVGEGKQLKVWTILELLSSGELQDEGRKMSHCVASYASSCEQGRCSIFSMRLETWEGKRTVLTIEVDHRNRRIAQARAKRNERPGSQERNVMQKWANQNNLSVSTYV